MNDASESNSVIVETSVVGQKIKRGRPSSSTKATQPVRGAATNDNVDVWNEVVEDNDIRLHEFRFIPVEMSGLLADLHGTSTAHQCFSELFNFEVQEKLVTLMNEFANYKFYPHKSILDMQTGILLRDTNLSNYLLYSLRWE